MTNPAPKFRYVRRQSSREAEPAPGVGARAVLALRLGAVLGVIIAILAIYVRSALGVVIPEPVISLTVLMAFLLPSAVVLVRAGWLKRHPPDPNADLPTSRNGGRRVLQMPQRARQRKDGKHDGAGPDSRTS